MEEELSTLFRTVSQIFRDLPVFDPLPEEFLQQEMYGGRISQAIIHWRKNAAEMTEIFLRRK